MTRKTKKQREAELLQRIEDIYAGAYGGSFGEYDALSLSHAAKIIPAIKDRLKIPTKAVIFEPRFLDEFESPKRLIVWIIDNEDYLDELRKDEKQEEGK